MAFGDADVPVFFADFGEPVTVAGITTLALVDETELDESNASLGATGHLKYRQLMMTIQSGSLPGLVRECQLSYGGATYRVREIVVQRNEAVTAVYVVADV